jgi:hypothetical protein
LYISAFPIGKRPNWKGNRDEFTSQKVELLTVTLSEPGILIYSHLLEMAVMPNLINADLSRNLATWDYYY